VVLTSDCMASDVLAWHEASLLTMGGRHDIVPGREIIQFWETATATVVAAPAVLAPSPVSVG
jgi:hypothetical protein